MKIELKKKITTRRDTKITTTKLFTKTKDIKLKEKKNDSFKKMQRITF